MLARYIHISPDRPDEGRIAEAWRRWKAGVTSRAMNNERGRRKRPRASGQSPRIRTACDASQRDRARSFARVTATDDLVDSSQGGGIVIAWGRRGHCSNITSGGGPLGTSTVSKPNQSALPASVHKRRPPDKKAGTSSVRRDPRRRDGSKSDVIASFMRSIALGSGGRAECPLAGL